MKKVAIFPGEDAQWKADVLSRCLVPAGKLLFILGASSFDEEGESGAADIVAAARHSSEILSFFLGRLRGLLRCD